MVLAGRAARPPGCQNKKFFAKALTLDKINLPLYGSPTVSHRVGQQGE